MDMRSKSNRRAASMLSLAIAGVLAGPVPDARASEQEAARLEDVVVTAQRRAQSLQDVPISITVFDGETLEANRVEGITDYLTMAPNVSFDTQGNPVLNPVRSEAQYLTYRLGVTLNVF